MTDLFYGYTFTFEYGYPALNNLFFKYISKNGVQITN